MDKELKWIENVGKKVLALEAEVARLKELVRAAYDEGADDWTDQWIKKESESPNDAVQIQKAKDRTWLKSDARKALAGEKEDRYDRNVDEVGDVDPHPITPEMFEKLLEAGKHIPNLPCDEDDDL